MNDFIRLKKNFCFSTDGSIIDRAKWHLDESLDKFVSFEQFRITYEDNRDYFVHMIVILYIDCFELLGILEPRKISRHLDDRYLSINDIVDNLDKIGFSVIYTNSLKDLANFAPNPLLKNNDLWILKKWQVESSAFLLAIDFLHEGIIAYQTASKDV